MSDRRCRICNAAIGENNPDGIGATCREVWNRAYSTAYYNFVGLDRWKLQTKYWVDAYLKQFANTKFRSEFKRSFYQSIKSQSLTPEMRISRKQLDIIKQSLLWNLYGPTPDSLQELQEGEDKLLSEHYHNWKESVIGNTEVQEFIFNCAKKHYAESSRGGQS
jgi:hypothetical protein